MQKKINLKVRKRKRITESEDNQILMRKIIYNISALSLSDISYISPYNLQRIFDDDDGNFKPGVKGVWTFDWQWQRRDPHLLQCNPALTLQ